MNSKFKWHMRQIAIQALAAMIAAHWRNEFEIDEVKDWMKANISTFGSWKTGKYVSHTNMDRVYTRWYNDAMTRAEKTYLHIER